MDKFKFRSVINVAITTTLCRSDSILFYIACILTNDNRAFTVIIRELFAVQNETRNIYIYSQFSFFFFITEHAQRRLQLVLEINILEYKTKKAGIINSFLAGNGISKELKPKITGHGLLNAGAKSATEKFIRF